MQDITVAIKIVTATILTNKPKNNSKKSSGPISMKKFLCVHWFNLILKFSNSFNSVGFITLSHSVCLSMVFLVTSSDFPISAYFAFGISKFLAFLVKRNMIGLIENKNLYNQI